MENAVECSQCLRKFTRLYEGHLEGWGCAVEIEDSFASGGYGSTRYDGDILYYISGTRPLSWTPKAMLCDYCVTEQLERGILRYSVSLDGQEASSTMDSLVYRVEHLVAQQVVGQLNQTPKGSILDAVVASLKLVYLENNHDFHVYLLLDECVGSFFYGSDKRDNNATCFRAACARDRGECKIHAARDEILSFLSEYPFVQAYSDLQKLINGLERSDL